jgi:hypothetical protein
MDRICRLAQRLLRPGLAGPALAAGGKRIDRNAAACAGAINDDTCSLVAENQGGGATLVMTEIGMHVGAADADRFDAHEAFSGGQLGTRFVAPDKALGSRIDKRFHFAVYPPSTKSSCPVT